VSGVEVGGGRFDLYVCVCVCACVCAGVCVCECICAVEMYVCGYEYIQL